MNQTDVILAMALLTAPRRSKSRELTEVEKARIAAAKERAEWNRNADLKRRTKKAAKRALKEMGLPNQNKRKG